MASASPHRHVLPNDAAVSYSGLSVSSIGHLPSSTLYIAPQPNGHAEQLYFLVLYLSIVAAVTFSAFSSPKSTIPTPSQFFTGESPLSADAAVPTPVPKVPKALASSLVFMNSPIFLLISRTFSGLDTGISPVPLTAIALSFLDPITAPPPPLPGARCPSLIGQERSESLSPAGPIAETLILGSPVSFFNSSQTSLESIPQRFEASLISTLPSLM